MNSRERLLTSLNHSEPDRIPIDLGGTDISSICRGAYVELMEWLGRDPGSIEIINLVQQLPALDSDFLDEVIQSDVRTIRERGPSDFELEIVETEKYYETKNEWDIQLRMPKQDGHYYDLVGHPLQELTSESLQNYSWPDPSDPARWEGLHEYAKDLYDNTDYGLVVSPVFGGGVFEYPQYLQGMEPFFIDLLGKPRLTDRLMEKITEILIEAYSCMLDQVGPYVQVVAICDDIATQRGPILNPIVYRNRVKPLQRRLIRAIKARTDAHVMYHGCGAMREFIPDLIDIGVDILNPVQVGAEGMGDTASLKKEYGQDLTFWGGSCENQHILPFGTPQEVRDETKRRIDDLTPGGGFVFSPVHNIQDGVPPENIIAMFETVHEYGVY